MASRRLPDPVPGSNAGSPVRRIRPLKLRDLEQVTSIERASFATPWSEATFQNLLRRANACLLAAVDVEDRVLGYAVVWFSGSEGELGDLAVSPQARRSGIGGFLVQAVLEEARARGVGEVFLEVREANRNAQSLYRRHGFETIGRRASYYLHPVEDALVMRRLLLR